MAKYRMKLRKGNTSPTGKTYFVGRIQNDRIMSKKETYAYLVDEVGGKKADHAAAWKVLMEFVKENGGRGNALRIDGLGVFRNGVKGGFPSAIGPWKKGKNTLIIECHELAEFRNALDGAVPVNSTQGDKPTIKSILNTDLEEYDVLRIGDIMSMGGTNLAPDTEKPDEFIAVYKDDTLVQKAVVTRSELNTVEFKIEGVSLEPGEYRIGIFTRCGDSSEDVSVKSAFRTIRVVTAA